MRRFAAIPILAAALLLDGCGLGDWAQKVGGKINPDSLGLADRCANVMQAAMPYAELRIDKLTSANAGISVITAHVEATRTDHENDTTVDRDLAADCEFDNTVLTGFHWTKGGPTQPGGPTSPSAPAPPGAPPPSGPKPPTAPPPAPAK